MNAVLLVFAVVASLTRTPAVAVEQRAKAEAFLNPIRKVVNLLQAMQKKVEEEGEVEKQLYERFMCYCKKGASDLSASISAAEDKVSTLPSQVEAAESKLVELKANVKQHQADKTTTKAAITEATVIRQKEAAAFASQKVESKSTIEAIKKAVAALEKGVAGGFLQTSSARLLRTFFDSANMDMTDREVMTSFLSGSSNYAPQSGQVIGILKQMGDTMAADLTSAISTEDEAIKTYADLMASKKAETEALTSNIEKKLTRVGELGVEIVEMKEDLTDTEKALMADKGFLANLGKTCGTKNADWEERSKMRASELVAIADTIKVLNDDDALDLFKRTLPSASASFLQTAVSMVSTRNSALRNVRQAWTTASSRHRPGLSFLVLALSGKKALQQDTFDKVVTMIDSMVAELKKEQKQDAKKKEYCGLMLDAADDKKKALERSVAALADVISKAKETLITLAEETAALTSGIVALDKSVAEATEQRKADNHEYKALVSADSAAKELLIFARNRLNKFYNPRLYVPRPKQELSAGDRIYESFGGELTTAAPGGIADTGIGVFSQVSSHTQALDDAVPPAPPDTWDAYTKKSEESNGVISMINLLIKDVEKELTEAKTEERQAQVDYETMMKESAEKRVADSKSLADKAAAKADTKMALADLSRERKDAVGELVATLKSISSLHFECDWLVKYYDMRKTARSAEMDSLVNAKAVLSGTDYSLLQVSNLNRRGFLRGSE